MSQTSFEFQNYFYDKLQVLEQFKVLFPTAADFRLVYDEIKPKIRALAIATFGSDWIDELAFLMEGMYFGSG